MRRVTHLQQPADFEAAVEESRRRPVLLFKHSRNCGVSCEALDELQAHVERTDGAAVYKVVTVQSHRTVSDHMAARLGIRHETPQAILLPRRATCLERVAFPDPADALSKHIDG